jgi:hypothetical protein
MHIAVMQEKAALLIVALLAVSCTGLDPAAYGNPSGQLGQKVRAKNYQYEKLVRLLKLCATRIFLVQNCVGALFIQYIIFLVAQ